jgi:hypothetical protein
MANLQDIVKQLTEERNNLDKAIQALSRLNGTSSATRQQPGPRKMSASARARISAAQKARWAKSKGQKVVPIASEGKRRISAAGRARIVAAAKARWARVRAGKK